jgi:hypothetical protein
MMALRDEVFEEHNYYCVDLLTRLDSCSGPLELSHDIPRGRGGSDVAENVRPRCRKHHRIRDLNNCPGHF